MFLALSFHPCVQKECLEVQKNFERSKSMSWAVCSYRTKRIWMPEQLDSVLSSYTQPSSALWKCIYHLFRCSRIPRTQKWHEWSQITNLLSSSAVSFHYSSLVWRRTTESERGKALLHQPVLIWFFFYVKQWTVAGELYTRS